jgi:phospholipid/cholesterol/gamma-HCH transport system permease protein
MRDSMPAGPQQSATSLFYRNIRWLRFVDKFGRKAQASLDYVGGLSQLIGQAIVSCVTRPFYGAEVIHQMDEVGVKSVSITGITALFTGGVLALQTAYSLSAFGGKTFVGRVVALSLVRELGPVLTALMVGGRVGSGITAELGSMTVTEQVDALRSMAISPMRRLVAPRVLATILMMPVLSALADLLGILGGLAIAVFELKTTSQDYLSSIWSQLQISDIMSGLGKTVFFGLEISAIACFNGLRVEGGAAAVGVSTTRTVVLASICILVSDFFLTKLFLSL